MINLNIKTEELEFVSISDKTRKSTREDWTDRIRDKDVCSPAKNRRDDSI